MAIKIMNDLNHRKIIVQNIPSSSRLKKKKQQQTTSKQNPEQTPVPFIEKQRNFHVRLWYFNLSLKYCAFISIELLPLCFELSPV